MDNVVPNPGRLKLGVALQAALADAEVKLFQNDVAVTPVTVASDLTEATFTGYVKQTVAAWGDPYSDPINGGISLTAPSHQFQVTGPVTVTNTIYGYYVVDDAGVLIQAGRFDQEILMNTVDDAIALMCTLNF